MVVLFCRPGGKYGGTKSKTKSEIEMNQAASNIASNAGTADAVEEPTEMKDVLSGLNSSLWSELL